MYADGFVAEAVFVACVASDEAHLVTGIVDYDSAVVAYLVLAAVAVVEAGSNRLFAVVGSCTWVADLVVVEAHNG